LLQDIKNTIKQSAIYGLSRISTKLVAFILLPIYSLHFTVSEYGIIGRLETLWQVLWAIFLFGLESGIVRWYTQIQEENRKKIFLFNVTIFLVLLNIVLSLLVFSASGLISDMIFESGTYYKLVSYTAIIAFLEAFSFIVFLLIRIQEKPVMYSTFSILVTLLNLGFQYYYIMYTSTKLEGVFLAKIFSPAIVLLILLPYYIKSLRIGYEKHFIKELIAYSFPIMLASLVSSLLNQSDRYFLGYLANSDDVGIFVLGTNISGLINFLVIAPFSLAFTVISWKKLSEPNAKRFYTKTATYFYLATIYIAIIVSLFTPHLIKVFTLNTSYWLAKDIVPWLALSMPLYGIHFIAVFSYYVTKKTNFILLIYTCALIIKVILNYSLIPLFSIYGSAIANYISFLALVLILYLFSKKEYFIQFEWLKIIIMTFCAVVVIFPFFYFDIESRTIQILLKLVSLAIYPLLLYVFKFYEPIEIERIKGFVNKYLIKSTR